MQNFSYVYLARRSICKYDIYVIYLRVFVINNILSINSEYRKLEWLK